MKKDNSGGLGLLSILTIIFVIAKLFGLIHWSWLLVFTPVFVGIGLWLIILVIAIVATALDK